ncbi:MAG TPA: DUF362 domain-containing protein [Dehalococcoidales bacterium]|nr:DUF362 domain-containing protein [Dehalococcoidales bacterium]
MPLNLKSSQAKVMPATNIFLVKEATQNDQGISRLIQGLAKEQCYFYQSHENGEMKNTLGLIGRDDVVLIKVNCQWDQRGGPNTDLLKSFIRAVIAHPDGFEGEIVIADNGQAQYGSAGKGGSFTWEFANARDRSQSVQKVVDSFKDYRVSTFLWDTITETQVKEFYEGDLYDGYVVDMHPKAASGFLVSYPKFTTRFGTRISFKDGIWDSRKTAYDSARLKVINWPTLKSHFIYGVTGCVKSYMGVVTDKLTAKLGARSHDKVWQGVMGDAIAETRVPVLNILDAVWVNARPGGGPWTPYESAICADLLMAGTDPVALDYWAAKHVLMPLASEAGYADLSTINPDHSEEKRFGHWLRLASTRMGAGGFTTTFDERQMNVIAVD